MKESILRPDDFFAALANLPEPSKPECIGMDKLHSVASYQPEELLDEELCSPEWECGDAVKEEKKPTFTLRTYTRSTTCSCAELDEISDVNSAELVEAGRKSFNSYLSCSPEGDDSPGLQPNRLTHDYHNHRMRIFLTAVSQSPKSLERKVDLFRRKSNVTNVISLSRTR
ncbi:unnamed protein product [Symbiodinium sp. KB8]|nr:unnamed protein product [Symbiodinium sp. KB8]